MLLLLRIFHFKKRIFFCVWLAAWLFQGHAAAQKAAPQPAGVARLLDQGRFTDALQMAQSALAALPPAAATPDTLRAVTYYWLARCNGFMVRRNLAEVYLDSAFFFVGPTPSDLRFSIEIQRAPFKKDESLYRNAIAYFDAPPRKNPKMLGETYLSMGSYHLNTGSNADALNELKTSLGYFLEAGDSISTSVARCHQYIGYFHWYVQDEYEMALQHFRKAEYLYLKNGGKNSHFLGALYINLGGCLDEMGFAGEALKYYTTALQNFESQDKNHPFLRNLYNNMGTSYLDLGDYAASIRYLEKATALAPLNGRYWNNLGDAYLSQGDLPKAESCFKKALPLLPESEKRNLPEIARPYHNLAVIYRLQGQTDSALRYELRALPFRKSNPKDLLGIARSYLGTGECYLNLGRYPEALLYLDSALWLQGRALPSHQYGEMSSAYAAKSRCLATIQQHQAAIVLLDSALYASGYRPGKAWKEVTAPPEMLHALEQKAALYYTLWQQNKAEASLLAAVQVYDTAAQAIRFFRNTLLDSESKATLAGQFRDILSGGVEAALDLHRLHPAGDMYLRRAFTFAEQSKALVLLEGVRSAGTVRFAGIPDSVLERERLLREAVTEGEIALKKLADKGLKPGDDAVSAAKNLLFDRQRQFEDFQRMLATGNYQAYHDFRYGFALATPEEVQLQLLPQGSCMLSYFIGKNNKITAFVIQKEGIQAIPCTGGADLDSLVDELRQGLFGYYALDKTKRTEARFEKTVTQYVAAAQALYTRLLAPVDHLLPSDVIIVPDGKLAKIPFELLLSGAPADLLNFGAYPYWFKANNRSVSYTYSATLLREMIRKQHRKVPVQSMFAMAPFFPGTMLDVQSNKAPTALTMAVIPGPGGRKFKALPYSGEELRDICALWNAPFEVGKAAVKVLFLEEAPKSRILHLSSHGVLDSTADFSFLAFSPAAGEPEADPLYIRDLYNLQLNADLVTLSACETGVGAFQRGEGVISLARAFAYAGAKSIVTSLWQVDNAATKDLMLAFYKNLSLGKPKQIALRDAKLGFIQSHSGEQQHPFFWAGLVGVGDMSPVQAP